MKKSGFTLIELMIVIAVIAILLSVLVPNFNQARRTALLKSCIANEKAIAVAVQLYASDNNGKLTPGTATYYGNCSYLIPDYLKEVPTCKAGHRYSIADNCSTWKNQVVIYTNNYLPGVGDPHPEVNGWYPAWIIGTGSSVKYR